MANDLNRCEFIGRLGKEPEARYMTNGTAVCNISIACGETWKDKNTGEKQEKTAWVPVVFFGRLAEIVGEYLHKGSKIYVAGKFQTRKWQNKDGQDQYTTEIVANEMQMLDSRSVSNTTGNDTQPDLSSAGDTQPAGDFDDDIPF